MRFALAVLLSLMILPLARPAVAADAPASTGTTRVEVSTDEWIPVRLSVHGVTVDRVRLQRPGKLTRLVLKHDEANRGRIVVTNDTRVRVTPAVAIAIFDAEGRLLSAANTGARTKVLDPGETRELDIHFGGVFRNLGAASVAYVSLEY